MKHPTSKNQIIYSLPKEDRKILFDVFFNKKKTSYLDYLKKTIPVFLNLHPSFWEDQHFLRWQLIRLNTDYQASVEKIWHDRWIRAGVTEQEKIEKSFFDFRDCIPREIDTYQTWEFAGWIEDKNGKGHLGVEVSELMEKWNVIFPPIPWVFRFTPRGYLDQVSLISGYGHGKPKRGRPIEDWAKNLLVYELSWAGMKNMEIARLVFGIKKSRYGLDKEPTLVRINAIKKTVNNIVSRAYSLPPST